MNKSNKEGRETRREYDKMGNLCQEVSSTGVVTRYSYNHNNRLECVEILAEEDTEAVTILTFSYGVNAHSKRQVTSKTLCRCSKYTV